MRRLGVLLWLGFLAVGCTAGPIRTRKPDADFSRGLAFAHHVRGSFAAWIQGNTLHVLFPQDENWGLLAWPLDASPDLRALPPDPKEVSLPGSSAFLPQAFPLPEIPGAQVTFVARMAEGPRLMSGVLGPQGWLDPPIPLSPEGQAVRTYRAALDVSGDLVAVWTPKEESRLWMRWWPHGEPRPLDVTASYWTLAPLPQGGVALLWVTPEGDLEYAVARPGEDLDAPTRLVQGITAGGGQIEDLTATASGTRLYAAWEVRFASGLEAGTSAVWLLAFPWAPAASTARPQRLELPLAEHPAYEPLATGPAGWSRWAPLAAPGHGSAMVADPWLAPMADGSVLLAVSAFRLQRLDRVAQISVVWWGPEGLGYQAAAQTPGFSQAPQLLVADNGQWLLWREGAAGDRLYLATTDPHWKAVLNRATWADLGEGALQGAVEALAGAALFPLAIFWLLPGGLVLAVGALLRAGDLTTLSGRGLFLVAFGAYQFTKALFLPGLFVYAPFSAWFDLPPEVAWGLRWSGPLLIGLGSAGFGALVLRRRASTSVPLLYLLAAGGDALLTLMLYGVNFFGVWT